MNYMRVVINEKEKALIQGIYCSHIKQMSCFHHDPQLMCCFLIQIANMSTCTLSSIYQYTRMQIIIYQIKFTGFCRDKLRLCYILRLHVTFYSHDLPTFAVNNQANCFQPVLETVGVISSLYDLVMQDGASVYHDGNHIEPWGKPTYTGWYVEDFPATLVNCIPQKR